MNDDTTFAPLDRHFAREILALHGKPSVELDRAACEVSAQRRAGHTCIALGGGEVAALRNSPAVGAPGEYKPLILDAAGRLYLRRYHEYERQLAAAITRRLSLAPACDERKLKAGLKRFFGKDDASDQARAARLAVERSFAVITGGPGTGKTHTVAVVLALLHEQFARPPRVALSAPTGKAATRMTDSIRRLVQSTAAFAQLAATLPDEATTLHRLLGTIPDSPYFRHNAEHPLAVDVVILDEASMADLALMAKLVRALPESTRLILLGDKDQLASVEAGNVLGDLCGSGIEPRPTAPIATHIAELRKNFRFAEDSGIHRLSQNVNAGDAGEALLLLQRPSSDLRAVTLPRAEMFRETLRERALPEFRTLLESREPAGALARMNDFRILCAIRTGPFGVLNVNRLIEELLAGAGLIDPASAHYAGRPIIITRNDYTLGVFNGDTGLLLPDPGADGALRAWFPQRDGGVRALLPSRLPDHETVFAMTVHKSQGSEFSRVLLLLPDRPSPVLSRELVYTGLTRARESVEVWFTEPVLRDAIQRRITRTSGLRDALWL